MAIGSVYLTKRGRNLLAKAVAGTNLTFTRFAIGDGYLNGAAIEDLNNVISFKYSVSISKKQFNEVGKVKLSGNFTNSDVGGFYYRELGLFATDPDLGEILYAYGNADTRAEYIPVSTEEIYEKTIVLNAYISNAASVTAVIDESLVFATVEDLNIVVDTVDNHVANKSNPHGVTPSQIGAVTPSEMGSAILAEKEAVREWAEVTFRNDNLLINGYLKNAVNQMRQISYVETSGITSIPSIDMFYIKGAIATKTANGWTIQKYGGLSVGGWYHHSELVYLLGETVTFSVKIDGAIKKVTGVLSENLLRFDFTGGVIYVYKPSYKNYIVSAIEFTDTLLHSIEWFKLEEGSVNTNCPISKDGEELTKCKYYFEILDFYIGNYCDVNGIILLPINFTEKRVIPRVTYYGWWGSQPGYIHYQPVGQGGIDYLTDVFFNYSKTMVQLNLKTRSNITATPAVGTFMTKNVTIDARLY